MASAGPVVPPLLPAAALRPCRSGLESGQEDRAGDTAGPARPATGTPCSKTVTFGGPVAAAGEGGGEGEAGEPSPVALQHSAQRPAQLLPRQPPGLGGQKEHVWFNSPMNSAHPITPYAEVYGVHPRFFNFDSSGNKVSACADAAAEAAAELERFSVQGGEPPVPDFEPMVNCMANYGYASVQGYPAAPAAVNGYDLSTLTPASGFGHQPWAAFASGFGFPDCAASYGVRSLGLGALAGDFSYAAYGYDYGIMAQRMLTARQSQEVVPAGGLPRPR